MHGASEQAGRIIIDLRGVRREYEKVERDVVKRFRDKGAFRKMILVTKNGSVFEFKK